MKRILAVILLFILLVPALDFSQAAEDLVIPEERPRYNYYYGGCCCEDVVRVLDRIYENQLINDTRNRPSTLEEIETEYYKLSGGRND